jgi:hypothetical protein
MGGHAFRPFGGGQLAVLAGEDVRHKSSCFADDVVIDFPSVAPAVDRIRRAFLAEERPATHRTAIRLTRRAASEGATLPLEVPVRCTCSACGGRGESWTDACGRCHGRGSESIRHQVQVTVPGGVSEGTRFYFSVTSRHEFPTRIELVVQLID